CWLPSASPSGINCHARAEEVFVTFRLGMTAQGRTSSRRGPGQEVAPERHSNCLRQGSDSAGRPARPSWDGFCSPVCRTGLPGMPVSFPSGPKASTMGWRTPVVIVVCGCLASMISFGPRATLGFFLTPMSQANDWSRDVFGLALAIQNILWGMGQPFAGAIADRYGTVRVLWAGGTFYAVGLILMAYSTSPGMLDLAAGVFVGFGLAGCSFSVVLAAFGKLLPERWRLLAFGAGTAAGSFGQFLYSPLAVSLMDAFG